MDTFVSPVPPRLPGMAPPAALRRVPGCPHALLPGSPLPDAQRRGGPGALRSRALSLLPFANRPFQVSCKQVAGQRRKSVSPETPASPAPPSPPPHPPIKAPCAVFFLPDHHRPRSGARIFQNCSPLPSPCKAPRTRTAPGHPGICPQGPHSPLLSSLLSRGRGPLETQFDSRHPSPTPSGDWVHLLEVERGRGWPSQQPTLLEPRADLAQGPVLAWARAKLQPCNPPARREPPNPTTL